MGVLDDKVAIVTGSARGIGRATAELLSEHGAKVIINDLDADLAEQAASEIAGETAVYGGDLTKEGAPDALSRRRSTPGARSTSSSTTRATRSTRRSTRCPTTRTSGCSTSTRSSRSASSAPPLRTCASRPRRSARRASRSSARSSTCPRSAARWATPARPTTRPARPPWSGLTKTLAKEWGQFKINVNAVAFGWIETRLTASKDADNTMEIGGQKVQLGIPEQMRSMAPMLIPIGRPGTPEEAAGGVFFLCSPWSNFVHGQVLNITGGQFTGMTT